MRTDRSKPHVRIMLILFALSLVTSGGDDLQTIAEEDADHSHIGYNGLSLGETLQQLCTARGLAYRVEPFAVIIQSSTYRHVPIDRIIDALGEAPLAVYHIGGKQEEADHAFRIAGYRALNTGRNVSIDQRNRLLAWVDDPNEHLAGQQCFCWFSPRYIVIPIVEEPRVYILIDPSSRHWQTILDGKIVDDSTYQNLRAWLQPYTN